MVDSVVVTMTTTATSVFVIVRRYVAAVFGGVVRILMYVDVLSLWLF